MSRLYNTVHRKVAATPGIRHIASDTIGGGDERGWFETVQLTVGNTPCRPVCVPESIRNIETTTEKRGMMKALAMGNPSHFNR